MRLTDYDINIIKQSVQKIFGAKAIVYLFGSRADDQKRGGDIDLYIETPHKEDLYFKKIEFIRLLFEKLGEQKIDVVLNDFTQSLYIYEVAKKEGIPL